MVITITGCGSGKEGDASKYDINETNIEFVTAPSQEYIVSVLSSNQYIDDLEPVTANNDPNGKLGKEGGYYSAVFFTSNMVNYDKKQTPIDNGTDGGGCVELYKTEEDAVSREKTLAKFKSSGGHVRIGTVIVRTSSLLSDQDQSTLEESICKALLNGKVENNNEVVEEITNYSLDGIENNSHSAYEKSEKLIIQFVNQVNQLSEAKIIKVEFLNNHTKANLKFDNGISCTVWDQNSNSQVDYDFRAEFEFNNGKASVDGYDPFVSTIINIMSGYEEEKISNIIEDAKAGGLYADELINVEYYYVEKQIGWQAPDHYRLSIDGFNYSLDK